ncbi:MAG TPA: hypothetical protein VEJ86_12840, partial [Candidatus Binataceae bacterium]|nr:hypothetical protein [Candidatus Binataceae bacterium]
TLTPLLAPLIALLLVSCTPQAQPPQAPAAPPQAASASGSDCKIDAAKICNSAMSAGTVAWAPSMAYAPSSNQLPGTARIEIQNGPTVQVMCYYNPQRTALTSADYNVSRPLDANAVAFLRSKGYCAGG